MLFQRQPSWHGSSLSQMPRGRRPHHHDNQLQATAPVTFAHDHDVRGVPAISRRSPLRKLNGTGPGRAGSPSLDTVRDNLVEHFAQKIPRRRGRDGSWKKSDHRDCRLSSDNRQRWSRRPWVFEPVWRQWSQLFHRSREAACPKSAPRGLVLGLSRPKLTSSALMAFPVRTEPLFGHHCTLH